MNNFFTEDTAKPENDDVLDLTEFDETSFFEEVAFHPVIEKYVVFTVDNEFYAINSNFVAEVSNPLPIAALPHVPEWLCGITNVRGEIISVIDLRKFWGKTTTAPAKSKFIVLKSKKIGVEVAFIVDRLHEPVSLVPNDITFSAADYENSFPTLFGKAFDGGNCLLLVDAEKLLASLTTNHSR